MSFTVDAADEGPLAGDVLATRDSRTHRPTGTKYKVLEVRRPPRILPDGRKRYGMTVVRDDEATPTSSLLTKEGLNVEIPMVWLR